MALLARNERKARVRDHKSVISDRLLKAQRGLDDVIVRIERLRESHDNVLGFPLNQREMAFLMDIDHVLYNKIRVGKYGVSTNFLVAASVVLDVSIETLLGLEPINNTPNAGVVQAQQKLISNQNEEIELLQRKVKVLEEIIQQKSPV
jgi:hypothetical protein